MHDLDALIAVLQSDPPTFTGQEATRLAREYFGVDAAATLLVGERDQNVRLDAPDGRRYLLRIANALEDPRVVDFENRALDHLARVDAGVPVPAVIRACDGRDAIAATGADGNTCLVRLLSWLPGAPLQGRATTPPLRRHLGATLARLSLALRGFFHPAAARPLLWDIRNTMALAGLLEHVGQPSARALCEACLARFDERVAPRLPALRAQVIYADLNPSNVLVSDDANPNITGIIDFGDIVHAPLVCDLAVAAAYQIGSGDDPLADALDLVAAFHEQRPLEAAEIEVLPELILARLVTTTVVTAWRASRYPENRDYILRSAPAALARLERLAELPPEQARARLFERLAPASPRAPAGASTLGPADSDRSAPTARESLRARRVARLGPAYRLFYREPLHIVRGRGAWLHAADGRAYLDAYNNVALLGHCHPDVVAALAGQAATLNTHTRYLHGAVVDYAERLLALLPANLDYVMFACTGSEANELALRMARAHTGQRGVLVSDYAYHGNTSAIAQMSTSYGTLPDGRVDWLETFPAPDTYRDADEAALIARTLAAVDAAIERLAARGVRPAAVWFDVGFTSDGLYRAPPGLLAGIAARVRAAGGLVVADEVQTGFARLGDDLWGFRLHDLEPDIVTLGKPIGNGHPLAATVLRREVVDAFARSGRYFNTFGGNPVSAAVGLAVLNAFQKEGCARNSRATGAYLHERLRGLMARHECVGDVRGSGLFAGVELVSDRAARTPDAARTDRVINAMKEAGVLISDAGRHASILKIRPPLCFSRANVDQLVATLDECLS